MGIYMAKPTLAQGVAIIDAAIADARRRNFAPLAVAVLDAGGHLLVFKREDGSGFLTFDIANSISKRGVFDTS